MKLVQIYFCAENGAHLLFITAARIFVYLLVGLFSIAT
jgi:hypothetical protein